MTNEERQAARRERRIAARSEKRNNFLKQYNDFNRVTNIDNLYSAYKSSRKGVEWKESVQKYGLEIIPNLLETRRKLIAEENISKGFAEFTIHERGKIRHIRSVHISERVVQKCLCDQILVPILTKGLIYDNGASVKNKGITFAMKRIRCHLSRFYRQNGFSNKGYALVIDFSKYFDNIRHDKLFETMKKYIIDEKVFNLYKGFITVFGDNISLGLGSQVSQISAIKHPDVIDHYVKEKLGIKNYARYMDDSYLIHSSKEYLEYCLSEIRRLCNELGIKINEKKTHIVSLKEGFWFLKGKYILLNTGKIICKPSKDSIKRMKRKLRKFLPMFEAGKISLMDVYQSYQSFRSHIQLYDSYKAVKRLDKYYNSMFIFNHNMENTGGGANGGHNKSILRNQGRCSSSSH